MRTRAFSSGIFLILSPFAGFLYFFPARWRLLLYAEAVGAYTTSIAAIWRAVRAPGMLITSASSSVCLPSKGVLVEFPVAARRSVSISTVFVQIKAANREPIRFDFKANVFDVSASLSFAPSRALFTSLSAVAGNY